MNELNLLKGLATPQEKALLLLGLDPDGPAFKLARISGPAGKDLRKADLSGANLDHAPLERACLREAVLRRASLRHANLAGANLVDADLDEADLEHADLTGADLRDAFLSKVSLRGASLMRACLPGTDLEDADLCGANLQDAELIGTNLKGARLDGADLRSAVVDWSTYVASAWTPSELRLLHARGIALRSFSEFGAAAQAAVTRDLNGLLLGFSCRLAAVDRVALEGAVVVLAAGTSCRLAEYTEQGDTAIVRLEGSCREDLEAVAEALYHRVWEIQERAQRATLAQLAQALAPQTVNVNAPVGTQIIVQNATFGLHAELAPVVTRLQKLQDALGASLSDLVDRLEKMELRLPSEDAATDQTAAAASRRELKLVRTWDPGTHPRTALDRLLAMLEPDELRLLLARGPDGAEVVALVPAGAVAPMVIASQAADELVRRGLVDVGFFARLVAARPELEEQVRKVAGMWRGTRVDGS